MRCVSLILIFVVATMASPTVKDDKPYYDLANAHSYFEQFIKDNNRQYIDDDDRDLHFRAFIANLEEINKLNADSSGATFGINKFADYTPEERKNLYGFRPSH